MTKDEKQVFDTVRVIGPCLIPDIAPFVKNRTKTEVLMICRTLVARGELTKKLLGGYEVYSPPQAEPKWEHCSCDRAFHLNCPVDQHRRFAAGRSG